jgi:uncharacterized protein YndB with AHSA1/START domain
VTVDRSAPVVAASEIEIAARPETVWEILTDFENWPSWNPDVKSVSLSGGVAEGSEFRWKAGPATISSTLRHVERPRVLAWTGKTFGIDAGHEYRIEPRGSGTFVQTEESYAGFLPRLLPGRMEKMLKEALDAGLRHLKTEAERRS